MIFLDDCLTIGAALTRLLHNHTFWELSGLRCVLRILSTHGAFEVLVLREDRRIVTERYDNADEAAVLAERLWQLFVDR